MPVIIPDLPEQSEADVSDNDLLLGYAPSAPSNRSRWFRRSSLLKDVVREGGNATLGTVSISALTATLSALTFGSAATIQNLWRQQATVTVGTLAASASETQTMTVTGIATTDYLMSRGFTAALPDGLTFQAWISAANTVSFRFRNNTGGSISGASYTARVIVARFA